MQVNQKLFVYIYSNTPEHANILCNYSNRCIFVNIYNDSEQLNK